MEYTRDFAVNYLFLKKSQSYNSSLSKKFLYKPFLFEKSLPNYTQKSISFQRKNREILNEKELFLLNTKRINK